MCVRTQVCVYVGIRINNSEFRIPVFLISYTCVIHVFQTLRLLQEMVNVVFGHCLYSDDCIFDWDAIIFNSRFCVSK